MSVTLHPTLHPALAAEATRILRHAGVPLTHPSELEQPAQPSGFVEDDAPAPPLIVVPHPQDAAAVGFAGEATAYRLPRDADRFAMHAARHAFAPLHRPRLMVLTGVSGGLGVSTLAAVLAATAHPFGKGAALVDLDPVPGSLMTMLDLAHGGGLRGADLDPRGALVPHRLVDRLPRWREVLVLSDHQRHSLGLTQGLRAVHALAGECSTVVIDAPRHLAPRLCDALPEAELFVMVGNSEESVAAVPSFLRALGSGVRPAAWVVRGVALSGGPAERTDLLVGAPRIPLRNERGLGDALAGGDGPWLSRRGQLRRCARDLWHLDEDAPRVQGSKSASASRTATASREADATKPTIAAGRATGRHARVMAHA